MKKLTLIIAFFLFIMNQSASAQCQANFVFNQQSGSNTISFVNTSTGNYSALTWYLGDGTTASTSNVTHTYAPGIYGVCLTVWDSINGCQSTFCDTLYINSTAICQASFTTTYQGNLIQFLNNSAGPYTQVYWNFGDGTSSTIISPWHQFSQPGVYTVCLTVGDSATSCFDTYCQTVAYQGTGNCDASFTTVDSAGFTWFLPTTYNPSYSYNWSFGDGSSSTQIYPVHQYNPQGTYLACLTLIDSANNCFDTFCDSVSNLPSSGCVAGFSYQELNGTVYFNGYNNGIGNIVNYSWTFGDGTMGAGSNPAHAYSAAGFYTVCLIIQTSNGCIDTVCSVVQVPPFTQCNAIISAQVSNYTGTFTGSATGGNVTAWAWFFSDGTTATGQTVTHTFPTSGFYTACLYITVANGCFDSTCQQVYIPGPNGNCDAQFQYFDSLGTYFFFPISNPNYYYHWNFGDGFVSNAMYPNHYYSSSGWYNVCLTVIDSLNNCSDTWCDSIYVPNAAGCQAYFTYSVDTVTGAVSFINQSQGSFTNSIWSFGDGTSSTSTSPSHVYASPGTYLVCLTILGSNCQDSYCDSIVIGSGVNCIPQLYAVPDTTFGNGNVYFFIGNTCAGWQYVWHFGDSTTGSGTGPFTHQYNATGWYTVCITAYDNNGNSITICDSVYALRLASGIEESILSSSFSLFPNPSQGVIDIKFELVKSTSFSIEILSIQGQLIQSRVQEHPSGVSQMRFDLSALESGMYLIRIKTAEEQINSRFSIQQ
ncbi:MAG: PKD domain-containing protein [Bacteroidia bacterium]